MGNSLGILWEFFGNSLGILSEILLEILTGILFGISEIFQNLLPTWPNAFLFYFQAFARPQLVRPNDDRVPLDKNTKDQSKIVNHIKELINNVVAQEQEEVKVGNLQKPLEFYDTVIKGRSMMSLPNNSNHSDLLVLFNINTNG